MRGQWGVEVKIVDVFLINCVFFQDRDCFLFFVFNLVYSGLLQNDGLILYDGLYIICYILFVDKFKVNLDLE